MAIHLRLKRVYDTAEQEDGYRILIDRLWPRGVKKEVAQIDLWAKAMTPSNELRTWFHEDSTRLPEFSTKYIQELNERETEIEELLATIDQPVVTLVTATKDIENGHAAILKDYLERR